MVFLNYRDARPIYEQVKDGLRALMVSGAMQPGEKLPSVRSLASDLAINPNTIQRAYVALEQEGYVCSVPGKGSFVAERSGVDESRRAELFERLESAARELLWLGETPETLAQRLAALPGKENET